MAGRKKESEPTANVRGEVTIELEGEEYHLRPSYEAIVAIEEKTGRALFELADRAGKQALSLREMGIVTAEMMRAYGRSHPDDPLATSHAGAKAEEVSRLILEAGTIPASVNLRMVLTAALTGGVDAQGEAKPAKGSLPPSVG